MFSSWTARTTQQAGGTGLSAVQINTTHCFPRRGPTQGEIISFCLSRGPGRCSTPRARLVPGRLEEGCSEESWGFRAARAASWGIWGIPAELWGAWGGFLPTEPSSGAAQPSHVLCPGAEGWVPASHPQPLCASREIPLQQPAGSHGEIPRLLRPLSQISSPGAPGETAGLCLLRVLSDFSLASTRKAVNLRYCLRVEHFLRAPLLIF